MDLLFFYAVELNTFQLQVLKRSTFFTILISAAEHFGSHEINLKDVCPELIYLLSLHSDGLNV